MALRDIHIQLEIDTGAGTLCPCSDDYIITAAQMSLYFACGIDFDKLDGQPVAKLEAAIERAIPKLNRRDPQLPLLHTLLDECRTHVNAVLSVI